MLISALLFVAKTLFPICLDCDRDPYNSLMHVLATGIFLGIKSSVVKIYGSMAIYVNELKRVANSKETKSLALNTFNKR